MMPENPLWTTEQVAEFLDFPVATIRRWRRIRLLRERLEQCPEGTPGACSREEREAIERKIASIRGAKMAGPPFVRIGTKKVRYRKSDVIAWAEDPI